MPTYTGKNATVTASIDGGAATVVGKMKQIQWTGSKEFVEDRYMGEPGVDSAPGSIGYEGSLTYHHDPDDDGQAILHESFLEDKTVELIIYPTGNATGQRKITMTAWVVDDPNNLELESKVEKASTLKIQGVPLEEAVI